MHDGTRRKGHGRTLWVSRLSPTVLGKILMPDGLRYSHLPSPLGGEQAVPSKCRSWAGNFRERQTKSVGG
jgi:hypothetical protein